MTLFRKTFQFIAIILAFSVSQAAPLQAATVTGTLIKWHPLTLDFNGPQASETDNNPNPFLDYRLTISLTAPSGNVTTVPGFFAGNGQGGSTGSVWRMRFSPNEVGTWQYNAQLRSGSEVAISLGSNAGQAADLAEASGSFTISDRDDSSPGFLSQGQLNYIGEHYLKFDDGGYWLKGGTDSPENLLGYVGIDGTQSHGGIEANFLHEFSTHEQDWRDSDPLFQNSSNGSDSRGLIGALNYLSEQSVNSVYLLPMNLGGDGQDTYPFVGANNNRFDKTHYDISKLHQWNQVFDHAQRQSIFIHFVLSETERANERWLDNGAVGVERKLFFRELVARFSYLLAAKWNLGEENDFAVSILREKADYLQAIDWSNKPITVHTQINDFSDYEQIVGDPLFSATSIQYDPEFAGQFVERWRTESANLNHPWVLDMDENTGGVAPGNVVNRRKQILYDVYFSGGQIEWYFGLHPLPLGGDINTENFRLREDLWNFTRHARNFMESELPFWEMEPADNLVTGEAALFGGAEVFAKAGDIYAVYLPQATGAPRINLQGTSGNFTVRWYNPRNGQFEGPSRSVNGGSNQALGTPPSSNNDDWVILLKRDGFEFSRPQPSINVPATDVTIDPPVNNVPQPVEAPIILDTDLDSEQAQDDDQPSEAQDDLTEETTQNDSQVSESASSTNSAAPMFADFQNPTAVPGETLVFSVIAIDGDGVAPSMSVASDLPQGMQLRGSGGLLEFTWQVPTDQIDSISISVVATDSQDSSSRVLMDVVVNIAEVTQPPEEDSLESNANGIADTDASEPVEETNGGESATEVAEINISTLSTASTINQLPMIVSVLNRAVSIDELINIPIIAIDPDGFVPNVWSNNLPEGASLNDNRDGTRTLNWTPNSAQIGLHNIDLELQDAVDPTIQTTVRWQLEVFNRSAGGEPLFDEVSENDFSNFAPILPNIPPQQITVGNTFRLMVRPIDPEGFVPELQLLTVLPGAEFTDAGNGARELVWTPSSENLGRVLLEFVAIDTLDDSMTTMKTIELSVVGN